MANQRPEPDKASKLRLECIKSLMRSPEADDQNFQDADTDQFRLPEEIQDLWPSGGHTGK